MRKESMNLLLGKLRGARAGIAATVIFAAAAAMAQESDPNIGLRLIDNEVADIREIVKWERRLKQFGISQVGPARFRSGSGFRDLFTTTATAM
jgi:hypothetical protein